MSWRQGQGRENVRVSAEPDGAGTLPFNVWKLSRFLQGSEEGGLTVIVPLGESPLKVPPPPARPHLSSLPGVSLLRNQTQSPLSPAQGWRAEGGGDSEALWGARQGQGREGRSHCSHLQGAFSRGARRGTIRRGRGACSGGGSSPAGHSLPTQTTFKAWFGFLPR